MAVNESIVTGRYFRRCTDAVNKVWQRISFWHKASDCEFDDGTTAQTKVGAIKGITTSTSVTETGYAADMTTVKNLQTQINELNSNLGEVIKLPEMTCNNGNTTLNIKPYTNKWKDLTADNFYIGIRQTNSAKYGADSHTRTFSKTYNSSTGVFTITNAYTYTNSFGTAEGSGWLNKPTYISPLLIIS